MDRKDVLVIDNAHRTAASLSAAGIMNPITGKRLNRPSMIDCLLENAFTVYPSIERHLDLSLFRRRKVLRLLRSADEQSQWKERLASDEYAKYLGSIDCPRFPAAEPWFGGFEIVQRGKWLFRSAKNEIKAGTTYTWDQTDEIPTETAREEIATVNPAVHQF